MIDQIRNFYNGQPLGTWNANSIFKNKEVLIIGPGRQVKKHENALISFIKKIKPVVIAINTKTIKENDLIDFRVACHPTRLLTDIKTHLKLHSRLLFHYPCYLRSSVKPWIKKLLIMVLEFLKESLGVRKIFLSSKFTSSFLCTCTCYWWQCK